MVRNERRGFFYQEFGIWGGVILNIPTFSMLKAAFSDWKSIKNKISMISESKEYEIETKMVHQQWWQLTFSTALVGVGVGGIEIWWGEFFQLGRGISKFLAGEGTPSPMFSSREYPGRWLHVVLLHCVEYWKWQSWYSLLCSAILR